VTGDLGYTVSMGEAVRTTGVARSTLQRRLAAGQIEGAYRNADGGWVIPMNGLIAAGFLPRTTPPDEAVEPDPDEIAALRAEVERLSAAVAEIPRLRGEVETLRAVNHAQTEHLTDLRKALETIRALPAGTPPPTAPTVERVPDDATSTEVLLAAPRRRWWSRSR
jgi:hypothetical protein